MQTVTEGAFAIVADARIFYDRSSVDFLLIKVIKSQTQHPR